MANMEMIFVSSVNSDVSDGGCEVASTGVSNGEILENSKLIVSIGARKNICASCPLSCSFVPFMYLDLMYLDVSLVC